MDEPEGLFRNPVSSNPMPLRRLAALPEPLVIGRLWRSRDRSACVYVRLLTHDGRNLADVRLWRTIAGRMEPSKSEGFLIDIHRLPEFTGALVRAHRRAVELQLIERRGPER